MLSDSRDCLSRFVLGALYFGLGRGALYFGLGPGALYVVLGGDSSSLQRSGMFIVFREF